MVPVVVPIVSVTTSFSVVSFVVASHCTFVTIFCGARLIACACRPGGWGKNLTSRSVLQKFKLVAGESCRRAWYQVPGTT